MKTKPNNEMLQMGFKAKVSAEKGHRHDVNLMVIFHPAGSIYYKLIVQPSGRHTHSVDLPKPQFIVDFLTNNKPLVVILTESCMEHEHKCSFDRTFYIMKSKDLSQCKSRDFFRRFIKLNGFIPVG